MLKSKSPISTGPVRWHRERRKSRKRVVSLDRCCDDTRRLVRRTVQNCQLRQQFQRRSYNQMGIGIKFVLDFAFRDLENFLKTRNLLVGRFRHVAAFLY